MSGQDQLYEDIFSAIMLLQRVLFRVHADAQTGDLSRLQLGALGICSVMDCLPISELAKRLKISKPQASVLVRSLEAGEYLTRIPGQDDQRVSGLRISPKGRQTLDQNVKKIKGEIQRKLGPLGSEERRELRDSLDSLVRILERIE